MSIEFTASFLLHLLAGFLIILSAIITWIYSKDNKSVSYKWMALVLIPLAIGVEVGFLIDDSKHFFSIPVWVFIQLAAIVVLGTLVFLFFKKSAFYRSNDKEAYPKDNPSDDSTNDKNNTNSTDKYSLDPKVATQIFIELEIFMHEEMPYLKHGYALSDLATDIGYPYHQISTVINQEFEMNFNDYINQQRIEFCKKMMNSDEWQNLTLEAIAYECGFNNRNSFTQAFKKFTGKTPSQYWKTIPHTGEA